MQLLMQLPTAYIVTSFSQPCEKKKKNESSYLQISLNHRCQSFESWLGLGSFVPAKRIPESPSSWLVWTKVLSDFITLSSTTAGGWSWQLGFILVVLVALSSRRTSPSTLLKLKSAEILLCESAPDAVWFNFLVSSAQGSSRKDLRLTYVDMSLLLCEPLPRWKFCKK